MKAKLSVYSCGTCLVGDSEITVYLPVDIDYDIRPFFGGIEFVIKPYYGSVMLLPNNYFYYAPDGTCYPLNQANVFCFDTDNLFVVTVNPESSIAGCIDGSETSSY